MQPLSETDDKTDVVNIAGARFSGRKNVNPVTAWLLRSAVWIAAIGLCLLLLGLAWGGMKRVFLTRNPHFTLRHIEVHVKGQLRPTEIISRLSRFNVRIGQSNLFKLDLQQLRHDLGEYVMISEASLYPRLPGTLVVEVSERLPVAQIQERTGRLLDADGWVMPPRNDLKPLNLPLIIGVRNKQQMAVGSQATDEMVLGALNVLRLIAVYPFGRYLDIAAIQLDYRRETLRLHLRARGAFRDRAQILLPLKPWEMQEALQRVEVIVRERTLGRQVTGFIDATYRINVPVLP